MNTCCRSATASRPLGRMIRLGVAVGLVLAAVWAARAAPPARTEVNELVRQLASDDFDERETATKRLLEIDEDALPTLRKALDDDDAEVRRRVRDILTSVNKRLYGEQLILSGHSAQVVTISTSLDGKYVLSGGNDSSARLWELQTGRELRRFGGTTSYWSVAFSPDGTRALGGGSDGSMTLWDVSTGQTLRTFEKHPSACRCIAFTPDGKMALTGCYDHMGRLWNLETGIVVHRFLGHRDSIMCVAVSPDGQLGVTGGAQTDHTLRVWDLSTGEEVHRLEGHTERIMGVRFSPDGKRIASGSWDGTVRLWNVEMGVEERQLDPTSGNMHGVAFSADGKRLASGGGNGSITVWDVATGNLIVRLTGHEGKIGEVAVVPGRIVSGGSDTTVRVWPLPR